jgi:hypothetical protein
MAPMTPLPGASIVIERAKNVQITNVISDDGWVHIVACNKVVVGLKADNCDTTALHLEHVLSGFVGLSADDCGATPCHMEACSYIEPNGVGFVGSNSGDYGIEIERGGYYDLTAGTLEGNAELYIEGKICTWSQLGQHKTIAVKGVTAITTA